MTVIGQSQDDVHHAGETAGGAGSFICQGCSFPVSFEPADSLPETRRATGVL